MENLINDLKKRVENNLRFIVTISIFFLSVLPDIRIQGSIIIVGYIICYIFFEVGHWNLSARNLKWINTSLLTGLGFYGLELFMLGLTSTESISLSTQALKFTAYSMIVSTFVVMITPAIALIMILFFSAKGKPELDNK